MGRSEVERTGKNATVRSKLMEPARRIFARTRIEHVNQDGVLSMKFHAKGLIEGDVIVGLPGRFNIYNGMCAATVGAPSRNASGSDPACAGACRSAAGGKCTGQGRGFSILIDFAHNGVSTESVLKTLRGYNPNRIIAIFGCGGNRKQNCAATKWERQ